MGGIAKAMKFGVGQKLQILRLLCLSVVFGLSGGCEPWPPGNKALTARFEENRDNITRLESAFLESGYVAIRYGGAAGGVTIMASPDSARERLTGEAGTGYAALLKKAGVYSISRENDELHLSIPIDPQFGDRLVEAAYVKGDSNDDVRTCSTVQQSDEDVICKVIIDNEWSLRYAW